jgi:signal transduction histidine kinase
MNRRSLTFRLVAWYCGLLLAAGVSFACYTYVGFSHYLHESMRGTLASRADVVGDLAKPLVDDPLSLRVLMEERFAPEAHDRFIRVIVDRHTIYVSGTPAEQAFDPDAVDIQPAELSDFRRVGGLWVFSRKQHLSDRRTLIVETGQPGSLMASAQGGLVDTLLIGLPLLLALAAIGGYWLVQRALAPVAGMIKAAEALTFNSPAKRLPLAGTHDLLDELGQTLNRMLERLDNAYQHASRFSADAAHELRTPLTIMRGELEFTALSHNLSPEIQTAIGSALEETIRLSQIVENLMALARAEGIGGKRAHLPVDVRALSMETIDQMQLLAEEKTIALACAGGEPVMTLGDRDRLKQVLVNLIDNAIKYTHAGGKVSLDVHQHRDYAVLEVEDSGIGISAENQASVFDRFFRVDPDRGTAGAGLGLAIVKSICHAHGGTIEIESTQGRGSTFRVILPLAAKEAI